MNYDQQRATDGEPQQMRRNDYIPVSDRPLEDYSPAERPGPGQAGTRQAPGYMGAPVNFHPSTAAMPGGPMQGQPRPTAWQQGTVPGNRMGEAAQRGNRRWAVVALAVFISLALIASAAVASVMLQDRGAVDGEPGGTPGDIASGDPSYSGTPRNFENVYGTPDYGNLAGDESMLGMSLVNIKDSIPESYAPVEGTTVSDDLDAGEIAIDGKKYALGSTSLEDILNDGWELANANDILNQTANGIDTDIPARSFLDAEIYLCKSEKYPEVEECLSVKVANLSRSDRMELRKCKVMSLTIDCFTAVQDGKEVKFQRCPVHADVTYARGCGFDTGVGELNSILGGSDTMGPGTTPAGGTELNFNSEGTVSVSVTVDMAERKASVYALKMNGIR